MNKYVAFSGGKDSTALALMMPDATPIFTDTGWEFKAIYDHLEKFERVTGREVVRVTRKDGRTLPDYIREAKFFPNFHARYCTRMFKIDAMNEWLSEGELCVGLRADEPEEKRAGNLTDKPGLTIRYPLREQGIGIAGVIRIDLEYDLLPRYPVYMARGGCKGCFYKRKSEVEAMARLVPGELDELQALEESVQDERGEFFYMFPNIGTSIRLFRQALAEKSEMFDLTALYRDAADASDKGVTCGLFCHR